MTGDSPQEGSTVACAPLPTTTGCICLLFTASTKLVRNTCRHLEALHADSIHALRGLRMPTIRNEAYRFCDVSPILRSNFQVRLLLPSPCSMHVPILRCFPMLSPFQEKTLS